MQGNSATQQSRRALWGGHAARPQDNQVPAKQLASAACTTRKQHARLQGCIRVMRDPQVETISKYTAWLRDFRCGSSAVAPRLPLWPLRPWWANEGEGNAYGKGETEAGKGRELGKETGRGRRGRGHGERVGEEEREADWGSDGWKGPGKGRGRLGLSSES